MCFPKAPDPVSVPERQAAQQPKVDAATRATGDDLKRKRGYSALIAAGNNAALAPATTTPTTLGG